MSIGRWNIDASGDGEVDMVFDAANVPRTHRLCTLQRCLMSGVGQISRLVLRETLPKVGHTLVSPFMPNFRLAVLY